MCVCIWAQQLLCKSFFRLLFEFDFWLNGNFLLSAIYITIIIMTRVTRCTLYAMHNITVFYAVPFTETFMTHTTHKQQVFIHTHIYACSTRVNIRVFTVFQMLLLSVVDLLDYSVLYLCSFRQKTVFQLNKSRKLNF